jgi:hypothetical protein
MEAVAKLAGLPHSEAPECTCDIVGIYIRTINDYMPDAIRQQLIPVLPRLIRTGREADFAPRAAFMVRKAIHVFAPAALETAGHADLARQIRATDWQAWSDLATFAQGALTLTTAKAWRYADEHRLDSLIAPGQLPSVIFAALELSRSLQFLVNARYPEHEHHLCPLFSAATASNIIANSAIASPSLWNQAIAVVDDIVGIHAHCSIAA